MTSAIAQVTHPHLLDAGLTKNITLDASKRINMASYKIFIVEDDPWYGEILEYDLSLNPDYLITRFTSAKELLANLHKKPDLITIDFSLPDMQGDKLYMKVRDVDPTIPVVIISAQEDIAVAVSLLKLGVADYLVKDDNTKDLLWKSVIRIRENSQLKKEVADLREELTRKYSLEKSIKGQSPEIKSIFSIMEKASRTDINVSITGETGTGKELVAKAIAYNSPRRKKPFVAVNMAAIPRELVESELFGHEKGAFTGAVTRKVGKFEEANGGTIFLDEIAELDLSVQSKLLRVLQEREVVRVGGNEKIKLDIRLIVATHKNLAEETRAGRFREDLYYRILGLPIDLPPLRQRGADILILAKYFLEEFTKTNKLPAMSISNKAKDKLMGYSFPGNIRELKSIMELSAVLCNGEEIGPDDISFPALRGGGTFLDDEKPMKQYYIDIIVHYLKKYDNDVLLVADKLDIGKSTIYKMIKNKEIIL